MPGSSINNLQTRNHNLGGTSLKPAPIPVPAGQGPTPTSAPLTQIPTPYLLHKKQQQRSPRTRPRPPKFSVTLLLLQHRLMDIPSTTPTTFSLSNSLPFFTLHPSLSQNQTRTRNHSSAHQTITWSEQATRACYH